MNTTNETRKLYDDDAYATEFDAVILSCAPAAPKNGRPVYELLLDQTLFFPEEGGQSPDLGVLTIISGSTVLSLEVIDVQIKNNQIYHSVALSGISSSSDLLTEGVAVHGKIDWEHRFSNMQQHSGEHIFSGIVHSKYGFENVGFHLSDQTVTMDYNGVLTPAQVAELELLVNRAIVENVEIVTGYPSKEALAALNYRSKKEIEGRLRIVTVTGYDVCACCAPHVHRTGEIGMLKVMHIQNYKGGVRLTILCGFRALAAFSEKQATLSELTRMLSTSEDAIADSVEKMRTTIQQLKYDLSRTQRERLFEKAASISSEEKNVLFFEPALEQGAARELLNDLVKKHSGFCGIFIGEDATGYSFLVASEGCDCAALAASMRTALNAKGGGTPRMIQGHTSASKTSVIEFFRTQTV